VIELTIDDQGLTAALANAPAAVIRSLVGGFRTLGLFLVRQVREEQLSGQGGS